jgi:hypothetical protein
MTRIGSPELSRRSLLQLTSCAAGAATILGTSITSARANKLSQAAASYKNSPNGDQRCATCKQFQPPSSCRMVDGPVSSRGWCKLYAKA